MSLVFKMVQPQYAWHNTSAMRCLKLREQMGEVPQQISGGTMIVISVFQASCSFSGWSLTTLTSDT